MMKVLWLLLALMLTACSSAPVKVQYYLLDEVSSEMTQTDASPQTKMTVSLDKLRLAKYLRQNKLTILDGNQLYFANQHLWAEKLEQGLAHALAADLAAQSAISLLQQNDPGFEQAALSVQLKIDHLAATQDGRVILQGQFWLVKDKQVLAAEAFNFASELQTSGFGHSVKQQRLLVKQLAKQLQRSIERL